MKQPETPFSVKRFAAVASTNTIALDLGKDNAAHGTVVLADKQVSGRGRQSRDFFSPAGGMYVSVILRPELPDEELSQVTLAAGVGAAEAIRKVSGISVQLKWPNDLYVNGLKIGGILTEAAPYSHQAGKIPFVVVGVGLNVNTSPDLFPDSLRDLITSIYCETGQKYAIDRVFHFFIVALLAEVELLQKTPEIVLDHWRKRDYLLKKQISWHDPQGKVINGIGAGLLKDGRYRLTTSGGDDYPVLAGDIEITEINGQQIK